MQYKKKTNATKKYCLLQQQNAAIATLETKSSMRDATSGKKLMQQRNIRPIRLTDKPWLKVLLADLL